MSDVHQYQEIIRKLEEELDQMTDALSQAWDQLVPFLEETPTAAKSAQDITPIIHALCAGADAEYGGVYLFKSDEWISIPALTLLPASTRERLRDIKREEFLVEISAGNQPINWAFVPILSEDDIMGMIGIGTADRQHKLTAVELRILHRMAERVGSQISAAKLARVRAREAAFQREVQIAKDIQQSIQPISPPNVEGVEMATYWLSAHQVGGDAWGWMQVNERLIWFVLDVAGKGLPAALAAVSLNTAIRMGLRMGLTPSQVLNVVNDELYDAYTRTDLMATVIVLSLDITSGQLEFGNAGHTPLLVQHGNSWCRIPATVPPIGVLPDLELESQFLALQPGDLLIVHSDGFSEIRTPARLWGQTGLLDAVKPQLRNAHAILDHIVQESRIAGEVEDDQTLIVTRILPHG
ncbi:MAG: PP2C family protein-serine/threonine phosphatase [Chloroflexota bacterium]|nr:PP2C family protein-serine/threonine phosphatase [Chloroflexota bacterium]